jgi:ribosomal protein S18 acetylase RimI-like enzyme
MTAVISRDYAAARDLRAMQALTQRVWSLESAFHIGNLAWERFEHVGREPEWRTRLWLAGEAVVAWAWIHEPGHLYYQVDPARPELFDVVLDWFETQDDTASVATEALSNQPALIAGLEARGYRRLGDDHPFSLRTSRGLDDLEAVRLPAGYRALSMAQVQDPERRALAHRNAWSRIAGREHEPPGNSRVTGESYRQVMAAWPYRRDLDWVVEAPDGRLAANCCIWFDEANRIGLIEPLGVDADFRRQGLGYAVCLAALHALREAGAQLALVGPRGDEAYPVPRRLYFSLGFQTYARSYGYARKRLA